MTEQNQENKKSRDLNPSHKWYWFIGICAALAAAELLVYWQVHRFAFINFDDPRYVSENRVVQMGLTRQSAVWAFTSGSYASNWHPLTWLSHMLDWQLFGDNAGGHHLVNLFWHIISTLLLFWVLWRMTGSLWPSGFVAALFGLHPLHVESVAWIAERKDVLSGFFWMLTIAAYVYYARRPNWRRGLIVLVAFGMGLMAKPMLVTLPLVLLLLDYWPLRRVQPGQMAARNKRSANSPAGERFAQKSWLGLFVEKIPLLVLAGVSSVITFIVQRSSGAVAGLEHFPLYNRISNSLVSYLAYLGKMVWPSKLAFFYPHPYDTLPVWRILLAVVVLAAVSGMILRWARQYRWLTVGWLWYLGTLVPVIGLVQVGAQSMADRYTYLPSIGIFIIAVWGLNELREKLSLHSAVLILPAIAVVMVLGMVTDKQVSYWRDSLTLCRHGLAVTENNYVMENNLGEALTQQKQMEEALEHFREALRMRPDNFRTYNNIGTTLKYLGKVPEGLPYLEQAAAMCPKSAEVHANLGSAYYDLKRLDEAAEQFQISVRENPYYADAYNALGAVQSEQGKIDEAIRNFQTAINLKPDQYESYYRLANLYAGQGENDQAEELYLKVISLNPNHMESFNNLGNVYLRLGKDRQAMDCFRRALAINPHYEKARRSLDRLYQVKLDEAIAGYQEKLQQDPRDFETHNKLGGLLMSKGQLAEAISHYRQAVTLDPNYAEGYNNLAWVLASVNDPNLQNAQQAVVLAERAMELTGGKNGSFLDTLSVAYAAAGQFDQALATAQKALEQAQLDNDERLVQEIKGRIELFSQKKPYLQSMQ